MDPQSTAKPKRQSTRKLSKSERPGPLASAALIREKYAAKAGEEKTLPAGAEAGRDESGER